MAKQKLGDQTDFSYRVDKVTKIVDGDTIDVMLDLGFDIKYKSRVRLFGIDTPESRTRDKVEKKFGLASKARLKELIGGRSGPILKTQINRKGEDMRGKFGRILGDFVTDDGRLVTDILVEEGHAVAYFGGSKEEIQDKHMANRKKLIREGLVNVTLEEAGIK